MKKLVVAFAVMALAAVSAEAHCGACGVGEKHEKVEKASAKMDEMKKMNIAETAAKAGDFTILLKAVKAAGLESAFTGKDNLTVFAPTDAAFKALPEGKLEELLKDKDKLTSILTYHVVSGKVSADQVVKLDKAETLNGQAVMIKVGDDGVKVNDASVIKTDIMCSNGIIHVIDKVILPETKG